jgi:hypothetical protein
VISEFERRAWEKREDADKHPPELAAKVAIDDIERGALKNVKHVIVIAVEDVDGGDKLTLYQAGSLSEYAAEGAMFRAIRVSQDGG